MSAFKWDTPTNTSHRTSYPAISPSRPELSQAGRTVLITGGSIGIGSAIARSFVQAHAAKLIILGRRPSRVSETVSSLSTLASEIGSPTAVTGVECDMGNPVDTALLWGKFAGAGTVIDVLVLNAASVPPARPSTNATPMPPVYPLLEVGADLWTKYYDMNVRAQIDWAGRFHAQQGKGAGGTKYLIHVSTMAIHQWDIHPARAYGVTKSAGAAAIQTIALDVPPDQMQIINFHPGNIYTEIVIDSGYDEKILIWDEPDLPGDFAVWAASPEARFLHGRFVWASWDVEELMNGELRKRIEEDPWYFKVGVKGL
ncbi:NAD(P)-binding protein [Rostrohypoxylon terebratum]|nr:NAD(P)-binding protein [Rostrohypoxylon terebratum]